VWSFTLRKPAEDQVGGEAGRKKNIKDESKNRQNTVGVRLGEKKLGVKKKKHREKNCR